MRTHCRRRTSKDARDVTAQHSRTCLLTRAPGCARRPHPRRLCAPLNSERSQVRPCTRDTKSCQDEKRRSVRCAPA
jgi:hypothetical protein